MACFDKKKRVFLSAAALLCAASLFSGCTGTARENTVLSSKKSSVSLNSSSSSTSAESSETTMVGSSSVQSAVSSSTSSGAALSSTASSSSAAVSTASSDIMSSSAGVSSSSKATSSSVTSTYTQPEIIQDSEPHFTVKLKEPLYVPLSAPITIPSLSDALKRFSEISEKTPKGTPEEIVQTLLERNILCFAALQRKCWTNDKKYESDYYYTRGTAPIMSDYLTSSDQIDNLFYGTYTSTKADYLIHYDDGEDIIDAFTDINGGLRVDFSMILHVAQESFKDTTYAAVISATDSEIVFGRYYEPNPTQGGPKPNNYHFKAVKKNGRWRLESYITDAPAYEQQYTKLIQTKRIGAPDIVKIAQQEVGNFGGEPYWRWYGFNYRIEWCAAFVSWCYKEAGKNGPFFVACNSEGIYWFKKVGQWAEPDYRDIAPGDAIFLDWDLNGKANHVGLVIGTDGEKVYTIEGNRSDACRAFSYDLDDERIFGYGLMKW